MDSRLIGQPVLATPYREQAMIVGRVDNALALLVVGRQLWVCLHCHSDLPDREPGAIPAH